MKEPKDNFTQQAGIYARYRPSYPDELFTFLLSLVGNRQSAWDCGTGNGQFAGVLAGYFEEVFATDISEKQLANAVQKPNIAYSIQRAESTSFRDNSFDLITVAQAIHWFDFSAFYDEVIRTIRPGGILAVVGYGMVRVEEEIDRVIDHFYNHVIGSYWDKERKYVDEHYRTIPFPFSEVEAPVFTNELSWTLDDFTGYIETWSAVQHFTRKNGASPVPAFRSELQPLWKEGIQKKATFPILLRVARIDKTPAGNDR